MSRWRRSRWRSRRRSEAALRLRRASCGSGFGGDARAGRSRSARPLASVGAASAATDARGCGGDACGSGVAIAAEAAPTGNRSRYPAGATPVPRIGRGEQSEPRHHGDRPVRESERGYGSVGVRFAHPNLSTAILASHRSVTAPTGDHAPAPVAFPGPRSPAPGPGPTKKPGSLGCRVSLRRHAKGRVPATWGLRWISGAWSPWWPKLLRSPPRPGP